MKRWWLVGLAMTLGVTQVQAQSECTVALKVENERYGYRYSVRWDPVPSADMYVLEESTDNFRTVRRIEFLDKSPSQLGTQFEYQSSTEVRAKYRLTASSVAGAIKPCSTVEEITYSADPAYRKVMQKSVIPLVGSTPGLNGSQFKTSLRLRATQDDQRGKLLLRRLNIPGTDRDPSIPYVLAKKGDVLFFEDIVASFNTVGLASLDIVPDGDSGGGKTVPFAEVRLFNVAAEGTFGTIESQTQPFPWNTDVPANFSVVVPTAEMRLNLGVRAFTGSNVFITVRRGTESIASTLHTPAGDTLIFGSAKEMTGVDVQPGDVIRISGQGTWVPMYTLTDNRTNDPALFIPPAKVDLDVEKYLLR